jgi:hypothetical protein
MVDAVLHDGWSAARTWARFRSVKFLRVELWPHTFLSEIWGEKSGEEHSPYKNGGQPLRDASGKHSQV